jgi:protein SCO1/2
MSQTSPVHFTWWLLLSLLLLGPVTAAGHGPNHASDRRTQQVNEQTTKDQHPAVAPEQTENIFHEERPQAAVPKPPDVIEIVNPGEWVQEKTGDIIPLDAVFKNEQGVTITLRQLIDRPTLLLPIYYRCPTGCSFELANLADAIRRSRQSAGSFRVISLSFNADETPETAATVKPNYTQLLAKDFPQNDWVFLTGDNDNILKLTQSMGYTFKKKDDFTFIHPSALIVLDKEGRIIKYIYGSFISGDVDLALAEAAKGTPASSIHRLLAFCFPSNPRQNQQVLAYFKMGTAAVMLIGGLWFLLFLRRKRSDQSTPKS